MSDALIKAAAAYCIACRKLAQAEAEQAAKLEACEIARRCTELARAEQGMAMETLMKTTGGDYWDSEQSRVVRPA